MALECNGEKDIDYLSFSESVRDQDWRNFFRANLKRQKNDRQASFSLFSDVIGSASAPDLMRIEAMRRVTQFADANQLAILYDQWQNIESREAWAKTGNILFTRFAQKGEGEWAVRIAGELMTADALAPQSMSLMSALSSEGGERKPASVSRKGRGKK
jgi:hypothetical protein